MMATEAKSRAARGKRNNDRLDLSSEDHARLTQLAEEEGVTPDEWIRRRMIKREFQELQANASAGSASGVPHSAKQERDRDREAFRKGKRVRVGMPSRHENVPFDQRTVVMLAALHRLVVDGQAALAAGHGATAGLLETIAAAFEGAFGDGESAEFGWAIALIPILDAIAPLPPKEAAPFLQLEPTELIGFDPLSRTS